ncbi:hypothetical protein H0X48_03965 [Candidatus Dependentiae bacterium]|nr:hypothetical protein [Candidatus Dependentiae bacterium]
MKKLIILMVCFCISNTLAYKWTINNKTDKTVDVNIKAKYPGISVFTKPQDSWVTVSPNSTATIDTGTKCVTEVNVCGNPPITSICPQWSPAVLFQCPDGTVNITFNKDKTDFKLNIT